MAKKVEQITGDTYKDRHRQQLDQWVEGNPIHNKIDGECCPDFSCCIPEYLKTRPQREVFRKAFLKDGPGGTITMAGRFLGKLARDYNAQVITGTEKLN